MKIKIIYPSALCPDGQVEKTRAKEGKIANLATMYLAALTPGEHEIEILDELFEDIDFDDPVDLVAITSMSSMIYRAFQISAEFRKRGVKTVIGGFHASMFPEEVSAEADAAVIGEAETVWPRIVADAEKGKLEKIYRGQALDPLDGLPTPRYDLLASKPYRYKYYPAWAGRGCPHNCKYCSVSLLYGKKARRRPFDEVIRDIDALPKKRFMFLDDNFFAHPKIIDLLKELERFNPQWMAHLDTEKAQDERLLDHAKQAGLETAFMGIESFSEKNLKKLSKGWNRVADLARVIENLHQRGIIVHAHMIFGIGPEAPDTISQTLAHLEECKIDELSLFYLTPVPGTKLFEEIENDGVRLPDDWSLFNGNNPIIPMGGISSEQQAELYWRLYNGFYSNSSIAKRFARFPHRPYTWAMSLARNLLVYKFDVKRGRSVFANDFSFRENFSA